MKLTKRKKNIKDILSTEEIKKNQLYDIEKALDVLKSVPKLKFKYPESVDVNICLGVEPNKSDHIIRSSTILPHGNGKKVRIAVFADGLDEKNAIEAGADKVGMKSLYDEIKTRVINYDVIISRLDTMKYISDLGPILGPRGLMPNIKMGTLTSDIKKAVLNIKKGQINYKSEKNGIIHCSIGKINFENMKVKENLEKLLMDIKKLKPATAKGIFIKKIVLSTTMGPGISIKKESLKF
jgi:large subunit ribosomal protein L1